MAKTDQDREDFEAAARADGLAPETWDDEEKMYDDSDTQWMWQGWQDALAHERARAQGEPVAVPVDVRRLIGQLIGSTSALLSHINPTQVAEDFSQQWHAVHDKLDRVRDAVLAAPAAPPAEPLPRDEARFRHFAPESRPTIPLGTVGELLPPNVVRKAPPAESGEVEPSPEECPTCGAVDPEKHCRMDWADMGCDHPRRLREVEEDMAGLFGTAPPPEPAKAEVVDAALWCAHVRGPDDVAAAASYDDAVALCDQINAIAKAYAHLDVMVVAYPALWPWDAQSHAANLAKGNDYRGPTLATPPTAPAAGTSGDVGEHGWVCWNDGPSGWFWFATRAECEHELSDDIHPATALEKALMNRRGNRLTPEDDHTAPVAARSAAEAKMHAVNLEQCSIFVDSNPIKRAMTDAAAFIRASIPSEEA